MKLGVYEQKSTFIKISLLFIFSLPSPILPTDEREMTERTTAQLPVTKKCCLLIFAIAIGCLVLAAIPASKLSLPFVHYPELYSGILAPRHLLCFCQWSGKILASFLSLPLAVMCSRISPITLLAFCLIIISNTIEFSSLHRLYPIARRASYIQ